MFITDELSAELKEKVSEVILRRGGSIVYKEHEASHIVYSRPPKSANAEGTQVYFLS